MNVVRSTFTKDYFIAGRQKYLPLFVFFVAAVTIGTIQLLCHVIPHHVPDWLIFAPISVAAIGVPERYIYGVGMTIAAGLFLFSLHLVYRAYQNRLEGTPSFLLKLFIPIICLAVTGLLVQAWIHLEDKLLDNKVYKTGRYNWESIVHTVAAGIFFGLATLFITFISILVYRHADKPLGQVVCRSSRIMKYITNSLVLMSVVIGFLMHPAVNLSPSDTDLFFNVGGFCQWVCVFSLMGYISTFTFDLGDHDKAMETAYENVERAPPRMDKEKKYTSTLAQQGTLPEQGAEPTTSDEEKEHDENTRLISTFGDPV